MDKSDKTRSLQTTSAAPHFSVGGNSIAYFEKLCKKKMGECHPGTKNEKRIDFLGISMVK
ncbi:hypothetical protein [Ruthenibacterium intestinale]|uniref:hypothetical protein n=1 Tax=Ruthenibacterium intestinale TaxID=3133163 RepID=UPI0032C1DCD3